jgi:hypothetical protein
VQLHDCNVLFSSTLLSLDEASRVVDAGDKTTGDFWVEGTTVASLVDLEDLLDPRDNFVGAGVGRLIKIDNSVVFKNIDRTFSGRVAAREGCEMGGLDVQFVEVL